jgi:hypothetical protein
LNQPIEAEEPEVIRYVLFILLVFFQPSLGGLTVGSNRLWRESQDEEIKARDEKSKTRRQETISKAERAIDQFYEDYNAMRKRQIRDNKFVLHPNFISLLIEAGTEIRKRNTSRS